MHSGPIPVALIMGFLGSGKTTFLKVLARRYAGRRILWIVNEFGALDIDGASLRTEGMETVSLPGGSIMCRCLATPFGRVMRAAADRAVHGLLDGVVIEASGIARPSGLDRMLSEFALDPALSVASMTCIVDPLRFPLVRTSLPCVTEQLQCSDQVLLNKADTVGEAALAALESEIGTLTNAPVLRCSHCAVDMDPLKWVPRKRLGAALAEGPDKAFPSCSVEINDPQDVPRLCRDITAIGGTLHRCKGMLRTPLAELSWSSVDWTGASLAVVSHRGPGPTQYGLVFISRQGMEGPAQHLARAINQGKYRV